MARFLLDMADSDQLAFLFLPQVTLDIQEFHSFYWVFFLLQNQGHGYPLCSRRTVERHSGETCSCRELLWRTCLLFMPSSQFGKKKANEQVGRKQNPRLVIPGQQQDPTLMCGLNYFTTSAFLPTAKLISNTKDKVCFAPFNTHFPVD